MTRLCACARASERVTGESADIAEALRYMGQPLNSAVIQESLESNLISAEMKAVRESFERLKHLATPRSAFVRLPMSVDMSDDTLDIAGLSVHSVSLARIFARCSECAVLAVTLGPGIDRMIHLLERTSLMQAVTLDACASVMADRLCDGVERQLEAELATQEHVQGRRFLTLRFSPGYGDLPMELTADLLSLLDASRRLGISLTKSYMMTPVKSVTALIGISSVPEPRRRSCDECSMRENCRYKTQTVMENSNREMKGGPECDA